MVVLAELEVFHSRAYSPTRRLALGRRHLPVEPPPGFGGILLGGIAAVAAEDIDPELRPALHRLTLQLEAGPRVVQPRLRHRFQTDPVGLARTWARLRGDGEHVSYDFDGHGAPLQMALAAAYAAGQVPAPARPAVFDALRTGLRWCGAVGPELITILAGRSGAQALSVSAFVDPWSWALELLGFEPDRDGAAAETNGRRRSPTGRDVQRRFRQRLRQAHPDHGADTASAAQRIAELSEARRILLEL